MTSLRFGDSAWRRHASATPSSGTRSTSTRISPAAACAGHAHVGGAAALELGREVRVADDADRRGCGPRRRSASPPRPPTGRARRGGRRGSRRPRPPRPARPTAGPASRPRRRRRPRAAPPPGRRAPRSGPWRRRRPRAARSSPSALRAAATTRPAPSSRAACTPIRPTTPLAPSTSTVSPALQLPPPLQPQPGRQPGDAQRDAPARRRAPRARRSRCRPGSACAPRRRRRARTVSSKYTRAPSSSAPTPSLPGRTAARAGRAGSCPPAIRRSTGLSPPASTVTSSWPSPADGVVEGPGLGDGPVGREDGGAHGADSTMLRRWTTPASPTTSAGSCPA